MSAIISTVDNLKRQAMSGILGSISLYSAYLTKQVNSYILNGSTSVVSLPEITPTYIKLLSAADFNAKISLAYLDLYTLYILNSANVQMFTQMQNLTLSKYGYLINQNKAITSLINLSALKKS